MGKEKILIADDEADIRELLGDFLKSEGFQCVLAANAFDALEKFKTDGEIAIVMSDIRMPGRTGLELLSDVKAMDEDAMVIMISAVKDIESAIAAMSKGAYDYVAKPFKLTEVALIARKALEKRKLILQNKEYQRELERMVAERTRELQNALEALDRTYIFTLRALVTALDTRDEETQGHSMRVAKYTLKLAELLGWEDQDKLKTLEYGALLHDIGKIGIPDAILRKPGNLTKEEWNVMKTHPEVGYKILHNIEFLEGASEIVLFHHERFNGKGYPSELKGKDIPISARIFAVADTVDAMTSERTYRRALTFEDASRELKKCSGDQFDPIVVEAFHSVPLEFWKQKRIDIDLKFKDTDFLF
ncbi:MAG TPA: HD domain-containing phosphohydrolase [Candidatus Kapabacteria bacterium]|nr:HD domain-containing phosphohydrolase [Candidatus Kapabacteria bacterium]